MPDQIKISRGIDIDSVKEDEFIHPRDAADHGYYGVSPETDRDQYTVAGVTKDLPGPSGTAKTSDKPDPDAEKRMKSNTEALRSNK